MRRSLPLFDTGIHLWGGDPATVRNNGKRFLNQYHRGYQNLWVGTGELEDCESGPRCFHGGEKAGSGSEKRGLGKKAGCGPVRCIPRQLRKGGGVCHWPPEGPWRRASAASAAEDEAVAER